MVDHSELKRLAEDVNSHFPEKEDLWNMVCTPTVALGLIADIERLKAEIAGLKTGYEAYEQVNSGLKAEVEGMQKELAARHPFRFAVDAPVLGYTGCVICGEFTDHQGLPCPKRVVFAMAKGE